MVLRKAGRRVADTRALVRLSVAMCYMGHACVGRSGGRFQLLDQLMEKMAAVLESRVDINTSSLDAIVRMYGVAWHDDTPAAAPHAHTRTWMMLVGVCLQVLPARVRRLDGPFGEVRPRAELLCNSHASACQTTSSRPYVYMSDSLAAFRYQHTPFARMQSGFFRRKKQGSARLSLKATVKKVSVLPLVLTSRTAFLKRLGRLALVAKKHTGKPVAWSNPVVVSVWPRSTPRRAS